MSQSRVLAVARADIVLATRQWIGTPYHHQASVCSAGTDCLGLVRGVYRTLYGCEPETPPAYAPDWAETSGVEPLIDAARRHLVEIQPATATTGDVLVFRWRRGSTAKHLAIIVKSDRMIHAIEGACASEVSLSPWWRRHVAGAFQFPGVHD